jgi:hypothetical protein
MMFEDRADEIFARAGVPKAGNEALWAECVGILNQWMAHLSVTYGMDRRRGELWQKQIDSLVEDVRQQAEPDDE